MNRNPPPAPRKIKRVATFSARIRGTQQNTEEIRKYRAIADMDQICQNALKKLRKEKSLYKDLVEQVKLEDWRYPCESPL